MTSSRIRHLTVKLRGRAEAPDQSRGCTLFSRTRGDTTESHGPLQRLLGIAHPPSSGRIDASHAFTAQGLAQLAGLPPCSRMYSQYTRSASVWVVCFAGGATQIVDPVTVMG
jgi:hypothetical protein